MKRSPLKITFVIIGFLSCVTLGGWAFYNRPISEPAWPEMTRGLAFSPYQANQNSVAGELPTPEQIDSDLSLVAGMTRAIRTYTTEKVFYHVPHLAEKHGLEVTVGAWINGNDEQNQGEIDRAIELSKHTNVTRILIGNETLLRNDISVYKLISYLDDARKRTDKPVSTAETWSIWIQHPELADHVDFITVHILPYWEGIDIAAAISFTADRMAQLRERFPGKYIVIGETGWPSNGRTRSLAVATTANQSTFLRRFLNLAREEGYDYFLMEAFDQPWKKQIEGAVGANWGIYDAYRQPKFPLTDPIIKIPGWKVLAWTAIVLGMVISGILSWQSRNISRTGRMTMAAIIFSLMTLIVWLINDFISPYMTLPEILMGVILLTLMLAIALLLITETHEWVEAYWTPSRRRELIKIPEDQSPLPRVSIHLPIYNEPPGMVIQTLNALANLNYPDYEVIVIDNNTVDENIWQPVAMHCELLGTRFKFIHVAPLAGYKAGALNLALQHTDNEAEIIGVIDSDYTVDQNWLNELVPAFIEPAIAIVQAPQDYRDENQDAFKHMCYNEYKGFFEIGMVTRNDRNAIIQHGTMTLVRKSAIEKVEGWAEWCITEDTELGLSIMEQGYEAAYTPQSYGRGLTPDTFTDYKKQRYRWAYGAVQIMKHHLGSLFINSDKKLTVGQRYHFICGWLPWFAQSANLILSLMAIAWSVGIMYFPEFIEVPHEALSTLPIVFFGFNLLKMFHLYRFKLKANIGQTIGAALASLSLSYTIGKAMLYGLVNNDQPFFRTPKQAKPHVLSTAIKSASEELLLFITFLMAIFTLLTLPRSDSPDFTLWICLLAIQSIPYGAAVMMSLINTLKLPADVFQSATDQGTAYKPEHNER